MLERKRTYGGDIVQSMTSIAIDSRRWYIVHAIAPHLPFHLHVLRSVAHLDWPPQNPHIPIPPHNKLPRNEKGHQNVCTPAGGCRALVSSL